MSQICKANPCCGNFYGDCEIPLPQHRSGLWFHNSEEYRRKADEQEKPATQEPSEGRAGEMTPDRAIYFLERFKREEKMLGPNEQWALEFAIAALSPSPQTNVRAALERLLDACIREFGWHPAALADEAVGDDPECEITWGDLQEAHRALATTEGQKNG